LARDASDAGEAASAITHADVRCDGCNATPIRGTRYACAHYEDCAFDLCERCYGALNKPGLVGASGHPVQHNAAHLLRELPDTPLALLGQKLALLRMARDAERASSAVEALQKLGTIGECGCPGLLAPRWRQRSATL
jgi:hypothetical protein